MSRTSVGRDYQSDAMFKLAASRPTEAQIMAYSESATAVPATNNTHTVLAGAGGNEVTADGFARAVAAYTHTAGTQTSSLNKTFTSTGGTHTMRIVGIFAQANGGTIPGAADSGILVFETAEPNPPSVTLNDSIAQSESIDLGSL